VDFVTGGYPVYCIGVVLFQRGFYVEKLSQPVLAAHFTGALFRGTGRGVDERGVFMLCQLKSQIYSSRGNTAEITAVNSTIRVVCDVTYGIVFEFVIKIAREGGCCGQDGDPKQQKIARNSKHLFQTLVHSQYTSFELF